MLEFRDPLNWLFPKLLTSGWSVARIGELSRMWGVTCVGLIFIRMYSYLKYSLFFQGSIFHQLCVQNTRFVPFSGTVDLAMVFLNGFLSPLASGVILFFCRVQHWKHSACFSLKHNFRWSSSGVVSRGVSLF